MHALRRYPVDNSAVMFSSLVGTRFNFRFRFSARLTEAVDPEILGQALERTIRRFPYFHVRLKSGAFDFFMEEVDKKIELAPDPIYPFAPMAVDDPLMRVGYRGNVVCLEMVHVLADGYGALTFLKTLLAQYFMAQGLDVPASHGVMDVSQDYAQDEIEDSYHKYARRKVRIPWKDSPAYQPCGPELPAGKMAVTTGIMDLGALRAKAALRKVSVTEYLAALVMQALYVSQRDGGCARQLPVRMFISSDLRRFYPSTTLRNFSYFCSPCIDPEQGEYSLGETIAQVHHQCRIMFTEKIQNALISRNVHIEKNIFMRNTPLLLKKPLLAAMFHLFGVRNISLLFTNMGQIELPPALSDKVERFDTMADQMGKIKIICGAMSYQGRVTVNFTRTIDNPTVEDCFFEMLAREGLAVEVERNM